MISNVQVGSQQLDTDPTKQPGQIKPQGPNINQIATGQPTQAPASDNPIAPQGSPPPMTPPAPTPTPLSTQTPGLAAATPMPGGPNAGAPPAIDGATNTLSGTPSLGPASPGPASNSDAYRSSAFGQSQINSGTAQQLATMAGGATAGPNGALNTAGLGPRPVATQDNWRGADAAGANWDKQNEAAHAAAGLADMQHGYNANETQEQLNARRGLTLNPRTGAWDDPNTRDTRPNGPTTYNFDGTSNTPVSQSLNGGPLTDANGKPLSSGSSALPGGPNAGGTGGTTPTTGTVAGSATRAPMGSQGITANTNVGTPAIAPATAPPSAAPSSAPAAAPAVAPAAGSPGSGVGLSKIDPNDDLRGTSILPTNTPDRTALARNQFQTYLDQIMPQFAAKQRELQQNAAANGTMGSGMFRTNEGNLDLATTRDANAKMQELVNNATEGTIQDQANQRNEYRGERDYQGGLENQAYNRGVQGLTLQDALTNSRFGRALQQQSAGQANNPAQTQLLLSQIFGNQATGAGNALGNMVRNQSANRAIEGATNGSGNVADALSRMTPAMLSEFLKSHGLNIGHDDVPGDG